MKRLSKSERKRLRQKHEDEVREQVFPSVVISDLATVERLPPERIVDEAAALGVNLEADRETDVHWAIRPPSGPTQVFCELMYGVVTADLAADFMRLEDLREVQGPIPLGSACISLSAKTNLHPANDFLVLTLLRCLGRLTQGTLADSGRGFLMDDWVSWSLDYMDTDMFQVRRVYDESAQDPTDLLTEIPSLRK